PPQSFASWPFALPDSCLPRLLPQLAKPRARMHPFLERRAGHSLRKRDEALPPTPRRSRGAGLYLFREFASSRGSGFRAHAALVRRLKRITDGFGHFHRLFERQRSARFQLVAD